MKRPTRKPPSKPVRPPQPLLVVNSAPIRKKARQDYEKARRALDRARQQIDAYEQTDLPEYNRWINTRFGALLTELRETARALEEQARLVQEVERVSLWERLSLSRAYEEVLRRREHPEPPDPDPSDLGGDSAFPGQEPETEESGDDSDSAEGDFDAGFGDFRKFFESIFGGAMGLDRRRDDPDREAARPRLRQLYRDLARRLHPDVQAEMTPQKLEWWHQAQAAYEAGDVGQLEVIRALCEMQEQGKNAATPVSVLQRLTRHLKRSLRELRHELTKCRCSPAWGFSATPSHESLALQTELQLRGDLDAMKTELADLEIRIGCWRAEAARRVRRTEARRKKPRFPQPANPAQTEFAL